MTLNTMPDIQHYDDKGRAMDNPKLALVECVCIIWFTLEYLLRLITDHSLLIISLLKINS